jgi:ketosteroid isomerase-like protein
MKALAGFFVMAFMLAMPIQLSAQEMTDADRQAIAAEIERLNAEFMERGRPEDADANFAMWSANAESYFVGEPALFSQGYNIVPTMEDLRAFFDPSGWNRQSTNITALSTSVAVLSPESAVHVTEGHFSITNMEGETGPERTMTMTGVWVKEDGAWKVVHWHQSWNRDPIEEETEG